MSTKSCFPEVLPGKVRRWRPRLQHELSTAKKIFVLGIGNELRADDSLGLHFIDMLGCSLRRIKSRSKKIKLQKGYDVPENYTGTIRAFSPDVVLIVDALSGDSSALGRIVLIDPAAIASESISTHKIPLSALCRYLTIDFNCRVLVLGIITNNFTLGASLSPAVERALQKLTIEVSNFIA